MDDKEIDKYINRQLDNAYISLKNIEDYELTPDQQIKVNNIQYILTNLQS